MRRLVISTGVAALLGGCATAPTPESPLPAPAQAARAQAEPEAPRARPPAAPVTRQRSAAVRVDNATLESFRSSWQRLRASLSPAQQTTLNGAIATLAFARYGSVSELPRNLRDSPIVPEMIRDRIDGMTYAEIVDLARDPPAGP
jgi:hypothetical protein